MNNIDKLLSAARHASGCSELKQQDLVVPYEIDKNATRTEILDFIMLFLCERIDLELSVFKGGYVLTKLIPDEARLTEDIDFSVSEEKQYKDIIPVLEDLAVTLSNKGIITGYEIKPDISPTSSGGIKMCASDGSSNIKIDIGWHDISWGVEGWKYQDYDCNRFEVERMLSDKISAIYSRKRFRRTKDIYDFFILTNNFDVSITKLRDYIEKRGTIEWDRNPFREDVLNEYGKAYEKLRVQTSTGVLISKPAFSEIIIRLRDFMSHYNDDVFWNHLTKRFE